MDFLLARISEDEVAAGVKLSEMTTLGGGAAFLPPESTYNPRMLVECAAKRRIAEEHYYMPRHDSRDFGFSDGNCVTCRIQGPCVTLCLLALPYADHPDYRQEWRP